MAEVQRGIYVGEDGQTTNAVENFFGNFKRSMKGTYRFCSEQHLARYLSEFQFRHNHRVGLGFSDGESRLRKSAQDDKWSFCLTAGTLCPTN